MQHPLRHRLLVQFLDWTAKGHQEQNFLEEWQLMRRAGLRPETAVPHVQEAIAAVLKSLALLLTLDGSFRRSSLNSLSFPINH